MLGLVFSTRASAQSFMDQGANGRLDPPEAGHYVKVDGGVVVVTGPGKIHATLRTERFLQQHDPDLVIHAGRAVALGDELAPGTLVGASFVLEGDRVALHDPTYPRMPLELLPGLSHEGTLVSQDHTDDTPAEEASYWERIADMRDDTGYAVAYVAAQHGVPCRIVAGITHRASETPDPAQKDDMNEKLATRLRETLKSGATDV
jgi:nucleoside phosphorylase